jgi:hypothetical protein
MDLMAKMVAKIGRGSSWPTHITGIWDREKIMD